MKFRKNIKMNKLPRVCSVFVINIDADFKVHVLIPKRLIKLSNWVIQSQENSISLELDSKRITYKPSYSSPSDCIISSGNIEITGKGCTMRRVMITLNNLGKVIADDMRPIMSKHLKC